MAGRWRVTDTSAASLPRASIVIPVRNEAAMIEPALQALQPYREAGCELIVVDGNSDDDTLARARGLADRCLASAAGRALQMNAGAHAARGQTLLFLHADTLLPADPTLLVTELRRMQRDGLRWGFGRVELAPTSLSLRIIAAFMRGRAWLTRVATGDQLLFVERELFMHSGGYALLPLMEDVELCKSLRRYGAPHRAALPVVTSARRWQRDGVIATVLLMWSLRLQYWLGVDAGVLARRYYRA